MKIAWHMPTLRTRCCGLSRRAVELASRAKAAGHDVRFYVDAAKTDVVRAEIARIGVQTYESDVATPLHWSLQAWVRRRAAASALQSIGREHELFITCQPEMAAAYGASNGRAPVIYVCGGTTLLHDAADRASQTDLNVARRAAFALDRTLKHRNERDAFRTAHAIVFDSVQTRERVIASYGIARAKCHTIHGGADPAWLVPADASARAATRQRLGLDADDFVVCWSGRISTEKHVDLLVRAAARMRTDRIRVLLVGDGPLSCEVAALIRQEGVEGKVQLCGEQDDVRSFLHASDAFAFPSRCESFGGALAEAMCCGLPCVGLRPDGITVCNANLEVFDDGNCGLLVDRDDPAAFAKALRRLRDDGALCRALGTKGRQRAESLFTWDLAGRELIELVKRVAALPDRSNHANESIGNGMDHGLHTPPADPLCMVGQN